MGTRLALPMTAYASLQPRIARLEHLRQVAYMLEWDQHTYMPSGGVVARAEEVSTIQTLSHDILTSPETGRFLQQAEREETDEAIVAELRELRFAYDRATRVPRELVEEMSRESSQAFPVWVEAKKTSDFSLFQPRLERIVELRRQYAENIDASKPAYAVLFNDYEPYIELDEARRNIAALREGLRPLIQKAADRKAAPPRVFAGEWPAEAQLDLVKKVVAMLGYDLARGRVDISPHPFMAGNVHDARITTRFEKDSPVSGLLAAVHETGHALYQQGLPKERFGMLIGDARDLVVHESQSRLWENHVGRSLPFWRQVLPVMQERFGGRPAGVKVEDVWRAVNHVQPTFIRVYADELTYHMHIALRFEIEEGLVSGAVRVSEVPAVWNDLMEKYLGVRPPDDAQGCLQDMHWATGSLGYFPTYSLGSMLAAQFHAAFRRASQAAPTDYAALREWLRANVHAQGKQYRTGELIERATGKPLSPDDFLAYAKEKYERVWAS